MTGRQNLYALYRDRFPADLDTPLFYTAAGHSLSYAETEMETARLANALLALGAEPGDRVTVQVEKSVHNVWVYLACLRAGLIYHPLNPAYTAAEVGFFLSDAEPALVITGSGNISAIESVLPDCVKALLTLDADDGATLMAEAGNCSSEAPVVDREGSDTAALLYSSGTTGRPKGIMLSHDNLRANTETLVRIWGFTANDRLLHMLPIYHVHGLFVGVGCVLMSGASMVWRGGFDVEAAMQAMLESTVMMGVPTYYTRLLANPDFDAKVCRHMRLFISGSAPLLNQTFTEFEARTGHTILERYGMTETGMNTSNPLEGERRAGTVGFPLPGVDIRVVGNDGLPVAAGETGDLQVKGPNVFSGYWRMPEKTAEDFTEDGFFNTGDQAAIDRDGYVSIVGRSKDLIITGGLNVYPKEVELVIDQMPGVTESAVIGVADGDFGESVIAVIVAGDSELTPQAVIAHCRSQLANFKIPKRVEMVDALPRNTMGKVQKKVLRERFDPAN